jgi:arylsulfatase A-like enzyme
LDLFTTFGKMAGTETPDDRIIDGVDLGGTLFEQKKSPRNNMFYYRGTDLYAVRLGDYKAHFITQGAYGQFGKREEHETPLLYNVDHDPSEQYDIAAAHPEIIEEIESLVAEHSSKLVRGKDRLADRE